MCKLFDELRSQIKEYCEKNDLSFEEAEKMSQSWNKTTVVLSSCDPTKGANGLLDDTPSPMVLLIRRENDGSLTFEKTEFTEKYLGKVS